MINRRVNKKEQKRENIISGKSDIARVIVILIFVLLFFFYPQFFHSLAFRPPG